MLSHSCILSFCWLALIWVWVPYFLSCAAQENVSLPNIQKICRLGKLKFLILTNLIQSSPGYHRIYDLAYLKLMLSSCNLRSQHIADSDSFSVATHPGSNHPVSPGKMDEWWIYEFQLESGWIQQLICEFANCTPHDLRTPSDAPRNVGGTGVHMAAFSGSV